MKHIVSRVASVCAVGLVCLAGQVIQAIDKPNVVVLSALDEQGLADNTLVLFTSDNGAIQTYREIVDSAEIQGHQINGPLRGQKTDAYEGGCRVPLLARWPGRIAPGTESDALVALTDLLATFADYFKVSLPENAGEDSFSFLGAMLGHEPRQVVREALVTDSFRAVMAIRQGDWKLILAQNGGGVATHDLPVDPEKPAGQLYHLGRDIGESTNLYETHPDRVRLLTELLATYQRSGRSAPVNRNLTSGPK